MQFQFDIASTAATPPKQLPQPTTESVPELLRQLLEMQREGFTQMLELQREHLNHVKTVSQENQARWRHLLARWEKDHPEFADSCKTAYPLMEKSYVQMLASIVEEIAEAGDDALDTEFSVQEFLDRYGMKVGQLSHLLGIIGPLSEAAQQADAAKQQQQGGAQ
jgi:transketolase